MRLSAGHAEDSKPSSCGFDSYQACSMLVRPTAGCWALNSVIEVRILGKQRVRYLSVNQVANPDIGGWRGLVRKQSRKLCQVSPEGSTPSLSALEDVRRGAHLPC